MSKPSVLDQKIATIRAEREQSIKDRDAAALQVKMYDHLLELLESPVANAAPEKPAVQRAARGSVQISVMTELATGPKSVDELEKALPGINRSSIRKALAALMKDGKVIEMSDGKWATYHSDAQALVHPHHVEQRVGTPIMPKTSGFDPSTGEATDDASVRED